MAKQPQKVPENDVIERTVFIPGWAYNYMIDWAAQERRDVKAQISIVLEQAIRAHMEQDGIESGNSLLTWLVA